MQAKSRNNWRCASRAIVLAIIDSNTATRPDGQTSGAGGVDGACCWDHLGTTRLELRRTIRTSTPRLHGSCTQFDQQGCLLLRPGVSLATSSSIFRCRSALTQILRAHRHRGGPGRTLGGRLLSPARPAQPLPPTLRTSHFSSPPKQTLPSRENDPLDTERRRRGHRLDLDIVQPRRIHDLGHERCLNVSVQRWRSQVLHPIFWE